jgi:hypothetical protein
VVGSSKTWGEEVIGKEGFLNNIAAIASIFGALRFFWSFLLDRYSFKLIYGICIVIQIIIGFGLPPIMELEGRESLKKIAYSICVCMSYNMEGAHFVLLPTLFAKLFGPQGGLRVFSVGLTFIGVSNFLNILILDEFLGGSGLLDLGFSGIMYIYGVFSTLAFIILIFFFKE